MARRDRLVRQDNGIPPESAVQAREAPPRSPVAIEDIYDDFVDYTVKAIAEIRERQDKVEARLALIEGIMVQ